MIEIIFRDQALKDLRQIIEHFRTRKDGSELRFEEAMDKELLFLSKTTKGYQLRKPPFRFAMLDGFKGGSKYFKRMASGSIVRADKAKRQEDTGTKYPT
ncbi:MAG: hypothetical protein M3R08_07480 [Bacteroidota bacterium]|nr:hypothetical protein [Bacteroidota bacterium]